MLIRETLAATIFGLALLISTDARAGGPVALLDDPQVIAPQDTWSGPYVGLSYGRVTGSAERVECFKLGQPKACDDPIFLTYPEYKVEVRTTTDTSDMRPGLVAGHRFDLGRIVPGVEVAFQGGEVIPGLQVGLDFGNVLPFAHYDRDGAALGIETRLTPRLSAGIRAGKAGAALTLSWNF